MMERTTPESVGIPSRAIHRWIDGLERDAPEPHSLMLLRHGKVVAEGWWAPNGPDLKHVLYSLSKSFTSTAVGLAISEGRFGLDDPVVSFFPDQAPKRVCPDLLAMRVRHLLAMCTGHKQQDCDSLMAGPWRQPRHWIREFLALPISEPPGTRFVYNTPATYMLSAIVSKTTGLRMLDYLRWRLFEPLGIEGADWEQDVDGIDMGGYGLRLRTEDLVRFGQLYLQKGVWNGRRLLPKKWIELATSKQIESAPNDHVDWAQGYGFQFWMARDGGFRADGAFGQCCLVLPKYDLVLAMTAGIHDTHVVFESFWDQLLPLFSEQPLPPDTAAEKALRERLAELRLKPRTGAGSSPLEAGLDGAEFEFEANPLELGSVRFEFGRNGGRLSICHAGGRRPHPIRFGRGRWLQGTFLPIQPWRGEPIVSSGAWSSPDRLEVDLCQYTDAIRFTFAFEFEGDEVALNVRTNVSFESSDFGTFKAARKMSAQALSMP